MAGIEPEIVLWVLVAVLAVASSFGAAGHAILWKRDPRSALGWVGLSLTLPFLGPLFYWLLGVNRVERKAVTWQAQGRRLTGAHRKVDEPVALPISERNEHLVPLRRLSDAVTRRSLVAGNRVTPLYDGEQAYPEMLALIDGAKESLHLASFIFEGDTIGTRFAEALARAGARGVEVRVIVDAMGEKYSFPPVRRLLRHAKNVHVARFLPLRQGPYVNLRNHRKVLIADGRVAITGGMNIRDGHLVKSAPPRDAVMDIQFRVTGPVVADLQRIFLEDWFFVTRRLEQDERLFPPLEPSGSAVARAIGDGPDHPVRKIHWILLGAIGEARREVKIMTPYFIPDRPLLAAMGTAAMRGVEVSLLLPGLNNLPYMHWASRAYLWELLQLGIRVAWQPPPFVHSKLYLVDEAWSLVGSPNLDPRSLRLNFELGLELWDESLGEQLTKHFDDAWTRSTPATLAALDARPLPSRLRDGIAKLLSPYL